MNTLHIKTRAYFVEYPVLREKKCDAKESAGRCGGGEGGRQTIICFDNMIMIIAFVRCLWTSCFHS
jgi:hypothetical protein